MATRNKGEQGEILALLKILSKDKYNNETINKVTFASNLEALIKEKNIIIYKNEKYITNLTKKDIEILMSKLHKEIKDTIKLTNNFELTSIKEINNTFKTDKLTAPAKNKIDLIIYTDKNKYICSVKSNIGSNPTIINASLSTNAIYKLSNIDDLKMKELNKLRYTEKCNRLFLECKHSFQRFDKLKNNKSNKNFTEIISEIDINLPTIFGNSLAKQYINKTNIFIDTIDSSNKPSIKKVIGRYLYGEDFLRKDIKALEIIVEKDLDINIKECNSDFLDELLEKIRFDRGSSKRYNYGTIYKLNNEYYIKCNLQLRIKS